MTDDSEDDALGLYDHLMSSAKKRIDDKCGGKENLTKVRDQLADIMKMPNTGLYEASLKCEAIAQARKFMDETHKPQPRPFCGLRHGFSKALRHERNKISKANKSLSCMKIIALKPTPTPTPTPTATATATVTSLATATPKATATVTSTLPPSVEPTTSPTMTPSPEPTVVTTAEPTASPTAEPTQAPYNDQHPADFNVPQTDPEDAE